MQTALAVEVAAVGGPAEADSATVKLVGRQRVKGMALNIAGRRLARNGAKVVVAVPRAWD